MRKIFLTLIVSVAALAAGFRVEAQINKDYFFYMGQNFIVESKYEDAIRALNILLKSYPDAYEAYYMRGIAKYNLDDLLGADHDFTTAVELNPVYTMAFNNRAITRARLGNYDDALRDFAEVIELRPDLPGTYLNRGITYFQLKRYEDAVADFDEFIKRDDKVVDAYLNRGTGYLFLGDTVRAMTDYDMAVRTNIYDPQAFNRRGSLYFQKRDFDNAMKDFDQALQIDSTYAHAYFNRAITNANMQNPLEAIDDFSKVIELDPRNALTYFNRAITRSQIGDYNKAIEDYDKAVELAPGNVLLYYNRAAVKTQLGFHEDALKDYSKSIELYPDFANAYINRSHVKAALGDSRGARADYQIADRKIAQYRSKLNDSTFSVYADTSRTFNQLLSFDTKMSSSNMVDNETVQARISMLPLFRFTFMSEKQARAERPRRTIAHIGRVEDFFVEMENPYLALTTRDTDISPDSMVVFDKEAAAKFAKNKSDWKAALGSAVAQGLVKQYTNSVNIYTEAIEKNPANAFLYFNRSAIQSEMIDFVSSISESYQRVAIGNNQAGIVAGAPTVNYNYDEAIADLNKAAKLYPEFPHIYYNRGNLYATTGRFAEAYEDYSKAIELYPEFAQAYYNRGLVQIYLKDTRKGLLDMSKAGELGIKEAYTVLRRFSPEQ